MSPEAAAAENARVEIELEVEAGELGGEVRVVDSSSRTSVAIGAGRQ